MSSLWTLLLVVSLLGCEVMACWLDQNGHDFAGFEPGYRVFHLLQMLLLIILAAISFSKIESNTLGSAVAKLVFAGLCFSLVGDVINSFLIDLSFIVQPQTLLSTIPFACAHFLYIACFWKIGRTGGQAVSKGLMAMTFMLWPLFAFGLWQLLVDSTAGPVLKWLSFGYAHMVVLMALTSLWPLMSMGKMAWVAAAGGLVFLLSDAFFGAWLVEGQGRPLWVSQIIWTTYFLAQLCMVHVPLMGRKGVPA